MWNNFRIVSRVEVIKSPLMKRADTAWAEREKDHDQHSDRTDHPEN